MNASKAAVAAALLAATVAGCGGGDEGSSATSGGGSATTLTVYSSLPLQGASRGQATAISNGMKLALEQVGGKVGDYTIKYESLDDSSAQAGAWTPEATSANARKVVAGQERDRLSGRVQLRRECGVDPAAQRGGRPAERARRTPLSA